MRNIEQINQEHKIKEEMTLQWILEVDDRAAFIAKTSGRPKGGRHLNSNYRPFVWEPLKILVVEPISPNAAHKFLEWLEEPSPLHKKMNFVLKHVSQTGEVLEKWEAIGAFPTFIETRTSSVCDSNTMPRIIFEAAVDRWSLLFVR